MVKRRLIDPSIQNEEAEGTKKMEINCRRGKIMICHQQHMTNWLMKSLPWLTFIVHRLYPLYIYNIQIDRYIYINIYLMYSVLSGCITNISIAHVVSNQVLISIAISLSNGTG